MSPPGPLLVLLDPRRHDRAGFESGEPSLDRYLREQAAQHHRDGISTTHVLVPREGAAEVLGYYSLSAAQVRLAELQEADRKRLPRYPVPAIRMARLAVARTQQGHGHGELLVAHAVDRSLGLRAELGVRLLLVDALHEKAASFYVRYGFRPTTEAALTLYLPLGAC